MSKSTLSLNPSKKSKHSKPARVENTELSKNKAKAKTKTTTKTATATKTKPTKKKKKSKPAPSNPQDVSEPEDDDGSSEEEAEAENAADDHNDDATEAELEAAEDDEDDEGAEEDGGVGTVQEDDAMDADEEGGGAVENKGNRRTKAKQRGYRHIAKRAGFTGHAGSAVANILSVSEVMRAAKWMPGHPGDAVYETLFEFKERASIAAEPLSRSAAAAALPSVELFARELMKRAVELTFDEKRTTISTQNMLAAARVPQRALKFSFLMPHGLVRHGQTLKDKDSLNGRLLGMNKNDSSDMRTEADELYPEQCKVIKAIEATKADRKAKRRRVATSA